MATATKKKKKKTVAKARRNIIRKLPARIRQSIQNDPQSEEFIVIQNCLKLMI